jgi:hypothetical protein
MENGDFILQIGFLGGRNILIVIRFLHEKPYEIVPNPNIIPADDHKNKIHSISAVYEFHF